MKLVIGIVRPEKANDVLEALYRAEVRGVSISRVQGHGGELDRVETYRGTTVKVGLADKVRFEIAVSDDFVAADDRRALRGRPDRRGRRRQDLRRPARAGGPDPHRRDRSRRRDPGGCVRSSRACSALAKIDTGDTAWMLVATALVLLMTPALGLFYAGLVRSKNTLNTFMMCIAAIAVAVVTWAAVGYSLRLLGGQRHHRRLRLRLPQRRRLRAARRRRRSPTSLFFAFQATFCIITTALVSGAVVERMRFGAFLVFAALWSVLVYSVLAHWGFGGGWLIDERDARLRRRHRRSRWPPASRRSPRRSWSAPARTTAARRCCRTTPSTCCSAPACCGSAGSASTAAAASTPARTRCSRSPTRCSRPPAPCSSGSRSTRIRGRQVTAIGAATAIIVGCVGITPAGGFISPGLGDGARRPGRAPLLRGDRLPRPRTRVDETLDVLAAHGIAGFTGILFIGFFAQLSWNGISDGALYGNADQLGRSGARRGRRARLRVRGDLRAAAG